MSLIISLENPDGVQVNLEVFAQDTFQEFLTRASEILGYTVTQSCISGDNPVSLTDNVYDYLLKMAGLQQEEEQESDSILPELMEDESQEVHLDTAIEVSDLNGMPCEDDLSNSGINEAYIESSQTQVEENDSSLDPPENEQLTNNTDNQQGFVEGNEVGSTQNTDKTKVENVNLVEKRKIECELLSIINKSAGVVRTLKLNDCNSDSSDRPATTDAEENYEEECEYLEEHLDEPADDESDNMEEGEVINDSNVDSLSYTGSMSSASNFKSGGSLNTASIGSIASNNNKKKFINVQNVEIQDDSDQNLPVYDSDDNYTDVEFLDEDILQEDMPKPALLIKEEIKEPDLEDDIDSYTIVKPSQSEKAKMKAAKGEKGKDADMDRELNEILKASETDTTEKIDLKPKQKPVYTRQELLDLLEGSSDSEADNKKQSKKRKLAAEEKSKSSAYIKQEKLNKNDFSKEFEKIAKMGSAAYDIKSIKDEPRTNIDSRKRKPHRSVSAVENKISKSDKPRASPLRPQAVQKEEPFDSLYTDETIVGGYPCRLCNKTFDKLLFAITHTMVHKLPDRSVYPCVLCQYGFTSYPQVRDHMKRDHIRGANILTFVSKKENKKKSVDSSKVMATSPVAPVQEPAVKEVKQDVIKQEVELQEEMDEEEWLEDEIEMLEEWLEEDDTQRAPLPMKEEPETQESVTSSSSNVGDFDSLLEEQYQDEVWEPPVKHAKQKVSKVEKSSKMTLNYCPRCKRKFRDASALFMHTCSINSNQENDATVLIVGGQAKKEDLTNLEIHRCALCGQCFHTPRRLVYHRSVHQAELIAMDLCCQECDRTDFQSEISLYDHINEEHNHLFMCVEPDCGKEFQLRSSLKIHMGVHGRKRLKCDVCLKQFLDSQTLKDHKITHLKVKPFQCHICLKFINRRNRLRMHLLAHEARPSKNSVLNCRHCHMAFRTVDDAKYHIFESEVCRLNLDPKLEVNLAQFISKDHDDQVEIDLERLLGEGSTDDISMLRDNQTKPNTLQGITDDLQRDLHELSNHADEITEEENQDSNVLINELIEKSTSEFTNDMNSSDTISNSVEKTGEIGNTKSRDGESGSTESYDGLSGNTDTSDGVKTGNAESMDVSECVQNESVNNSSSAISGSDVNTESMEVNEIGEIDSVNIGNTVAGDFGNLGNSVSEELSSKEKSSHLKNTDSKSIGIAGHTDSNVNSIGNTESRDAGIGGNTESNVSGAGNTESDENLKIVKMSNNTIENGEIISKDAIKDIRKREKNSKALLPGEDEIQEEEENLAENFKRVDELLAELPETLKVFIGAEQLLMVFRCEYCEKVFCTKDSLNQHREIHKNKVLPFECNVCKLTFETFARVTSHKVRHGFFKLKTTAEGDIEALEEDGQVREKSASQVSGYNPFPVVKYFLCQLCGRTFLHHTYYSVHVRKHHAAPGESSIPCPTCDKSFPTKHLLHTHLRRAHIGRQKLLVQQQQHNSYQRNTKPINTNYRCMDCHENFTTRKSLLRHQKVVHSEMAMWSDSFFKTQGPYTCNVCHKVYQTKAGLQGHIRVHNGMLFLCALCGSGFAHQAGLATHHKRVHLRDYSHKCNECGCSFFSSAELLTHVRNHTGEKPYPCLYCNMSFRTNSRRSEHQRIHTGERPFPCDICGLAFRRSIAMKNHRLIHTGHRPHVCQFCGKQFHIKSNLRTHIKTKHSTKYVVMKVKGGPLERAAFEESLNSLLGVAEEDEGDTTDAKENFNTVEIEVPLIEETTPQDSQMILSTLNSVVEGSQYIVYQTEAVEDVGESQNVQEYEMEELKREDGGLKYHVKILPS